MRRTNSGRTRVILLRFIYFYLLKKSSSAFFQSLMKFATRIHSPYYIAVDRFRNWLCESPQASREGTRAIALFACSFAVLQPEIACDLLTILIEAGPAFGDLLLDEVPEDKRTVGCGNSNGPVGISLPSGSEASRPISLPDLSNAGDSENTHEVGLDDKVVPRRCPLRICTGKERTTQATMGIRPSEIPIPQKRPGVRMRTVSKQR